VSRRGRTGVRDLAGRRCLITGAAGGIGRATAIAAARRGAELYLTDIQAGALEEVAGEIRDGGAGSIGYARAADLTDHDAVVAMAAEIHAAHGSMDVVMNVAGIAVWGTIQDLEHSQWQKTIDVNLLGPISVLECFVPPMIEAGRGGHIVNVSSAAGLFGLAWHGPYSATKFGLRGVSEVLRFDLRRHGIGVSLVCPGGVRTPLVGTVEIAGVDRDDPAFEPEIQRFERHAVTAERAAEKILEGVEKGRYLVYTSNDIRVLHLCQRYFPPVYLLVMRAISARFEKVAGSRRLAGT
jgi:NAD(P)-dependent dehydrogenase (short-subunit alcohol dehydrogenase family)